MSRFRPVRVRDIRRETADTVSVALDAPADFSFTPGQYLTLRTIVDGEELRRSYSICSGVDDGELRLAIKRVEGGRFSGWAHESLGVGDVVDVMPPDGRFVLPPADAPRVYAGFAAGSGITPILSILKTVLSREPASRFFLVYGSRSTNEIIFRDILEDLKDRFLGRLSVTHILSREQQDVPILNGRIDGEKVRTILSGVLRGQSIDHAFVCGPSDMIDIVGDTLVAAGVPPDRVHSERFTGAGVIAPPPRPQVTADAPAFARARVVADGISTEVPVAEGESLLDAALRAGLDLPYSCRGGMCSTCRARLVEGTAEMAVNFSLQPWETEAGFTLTCQARPTSPRVVVDYDAV